MVDSERTPTRTPQPTFKSGKNENAVPTNLITYKGQCLRVPCHHDPTPIRDWNQLTAQVAVFRRASIPML